MLVDLSDTWLGFSVREDLIAAGLKVGDRFTVNIPALGNREVAAQVHATAAKGEMPAGVRRGRPAISICAPLRSLLIRWTKSTGLAGDERLYQKGVGSKRLDPLDKLDLGSLAHRVNDHY